MRKLIPAAVAAALILTAGAARVAAQDAGGVQVDRFVTAYRIGPKDLLEIKVREDVKLTTEARVSEQGTVNLPFLGEVRVEGLTAAELEKKLVELYTKWYNDPHVAVTIKEHESKQVSVLGGVAKPGFVQLLGRLTLIEAITAAGGLTKEAAREIIVLRTYQDGTTKNLRVPIDDLMIKGDPGSNIPLEPGDNVIIQVDRTVFIYISGQVKNPGALPVLKSRPPLLSQAIAQAGGFTERAARRRVVVRRTDEKGQEKTFEVNVLDILGGKRKDFPLEENDVIYVPESWL
jgi:polysaccharide export outer membrane protein